MQTTTFKRVATHALHPVNDDSWSEATSPGIPAPVADPAVAEYDVPAGGVYWVSVADLIAAEQDGDGAASLMSTASPQVQILPTAVVKIVPSVVGHSWSLPAAPVVTPPRTTRR